MKPTLLFDLDGTLVDTLPDLTATLNRTLGAAGLQPFATAEVATMIGDGVTVLLTRALARRNRPFDAALLTRFHADYSAALSVASRPYPGTVETLTALANSGWLLAVATNKPEAPARKLLQALDLAKFFAAIGGGDSFPVRKPDPGHLLLTLAAAGGDRRRAAMLGDHANDVKAARAAGLTPVFALWGYGSETMADGAQTASKITDLPPLLERLIEPRAQAPSASPATSGCQ
ncbi:MAG: HAD-IA family hydrolase [Stellaceae bacterium]